jgi:hypothetical protein
LLNRLVRDFIKPMLVREIVSMKRKLCIRSIVKYLTLIFISAVFVSILTACSKPANEPVEVTFENITRHEKGTLVAIEGYLNLPPSTTYWFEYDTTRLELLNFDYLQNWQRIDIYIVEVEYGKTSEPNRMDSLPITYENEDLKVWLDDCTAAGDGDAVRITGWLGIYDNGDAYINPVEKIEAASEPPIEEALDESEGEIVEETTTEGKRVWASYWEGSYEIYICNEDFSGQRRITNNPADDLNPSLSPDETKIVFKSDRDGNDEIYIMNIDGSEQTRLTNSPGWDEQPRFSPDGSKIIFVSRRDGNNEIYIMNVDGSEQTNLTNNTASDLLPTAVTSFSPDGSKITFESLRDGNWEIYIMNADGSGQVNLSNNPAADMNPSFSTDGSKIIFDSERDGNWESYIMNLDGSEQTQYEEEF